MRSCSVKGIRGNPFCIWTLLSFFVDKKPEFIARPLHLIRCTFSGAKSRLQGENQLYQPLLLFGNEKKGVFSRTVYKENGFRATNEKSGTRI